MTTRTRQLVITGFVVTSLLIGGVSCSENTDGGDVIGEPDDIPTGPGAEAPPPLSSRMAQSQLIVTGTVVDIDGSGATIEIDDVLKGEAETGDTIVVSTSTPPTVRELAVGDVGAWLVSEQGNPPGLLGGGPVGITEKEIRLELEG